MSLPILNLFYLYRDDEELQTLQEQYLKIDDGLGWNVGFQHEGSETPTLEEFKATLRKKIEEANAA